MGAQISLTIDKYGFHPDIIGKVTVDVRALQAPLQAITLVERGALAPTKCVIRVKSAHQSSKQYYEETF